MRVAEGMFARTCAAATTYDCVSIARARNRTSQCALPVGTVNAEGKVIMSAPRRLRARLISGKRSCTQSVMKVKLVGRGSDIEAYRRGDLPDGGVEWRQDPGPGFDASGSKSHQMSVARLRSLGDSLALLQHRPILDIHIKEMDLLISLRNLAELIYPQDSVLDAVCIETRLVDTDVDWQLLAAGFFLQTEDKLALVDWFDEFDCFFP